MRNDALRAQCLCASEWATLLGIDPFGKTPLTLYLLKMGPIDPIRETPDMRWGRLLEDGCLQAYAEDTGRTLIEQDTARHPAYEWIAATPDALVQGDDRGVEVKVVGPGKTKDWDDGIPSYVEAQCRINMAVFNRERWDVCRLFRLNNDWEILELTRDRDLEAMLIDEGRHFLETYWRPQVMPDIDGHPLVGDYFSKQRSTTLADTMYASGRQHTLVEQFIETRRQLAELTWENRRQKHLIMSVMGRYTTLEGSWGRITWKRNKNGTRVFRPDFYEQEESLSNGE